MEKAVSNKAYYRPEIPDNVSEILSVRKKFPYNLLSTIIRYCDEWDFKEVPFSNLEQSFYHMVNIGLYTVLSDDRNNNWFLTDEEFWVLNYKYKGGYSLKKISEMLGSSLSRINGIHRIAIRKVTDYLHRTHGSDNILYSTVSSKAKSWLVRKVNIRTVDELLSVSLDELFYKYDCGKVIYKELLDYVVSKKANMTVDSVPFLQFFSQKTKDFLFNKNIFSYDVLVKLTPLQLKELGMDKDTYFEVLNYIWNMGSPNNIRRYFYENNRL